MLIAKNRYWVLPCCKLCLALSQAKAEGKDTFWQGPPTLARDTHDEYLWQVLLKSVRCVRGCRVARNRYLNGQWKDQGRRMNGRQTRIQNASRRLLIAMES